MNPILNASIARNPWMNPLATEITAASDLLFDCFQSGHKALCCGNGGSAADSDHMAGEMLKGFLLPRKINDPLAETLGPDLAPNLQGGLPLIPLGGFTAYTTAWANDCDPEYQFAQLTHVLGKPGDVLVAFTTSGRSKNVLQAIKTARAIEMKVILFTGESGLPAAELAHVALKAPAKQVDHVQECHLPIYHCLCAMVEDRVFGA